MRCSVSVIGVGGGGGGGGGIIETLVSLAFGEYDGRRLWEKPSYVMRCIIFQGYTYCIGRYTRKCVALFFIRLYKNIY